MQLWRHSQHSKYSIGIPNNLSRYKCAVINVMKLTDIYIHQQVLHISSIYVGSSLSDCGQSSTNCLKSPLKKIKYREQARVEGCLWGFLCTSKQAQSYCSYSTLFTCLFLYLGPEFNCNYSVQIGDHRVPFVKKKG